MLRDLLLLLEVLVSAPVIEATALTEEVIKVEVEIVATKVLALLTLTLLMLLHTFFARLVVYSALVGV